MHGRSNGGLLVGAAMTQRPELFAAALPTVGVLDMLRFHLFTIGWAWTTEYGTPDDADDFAVLLGVLAAAPTACRARPYPPTLICTGDHDDRVVPAHSLKFGAELQRCQAGPAPVLLRVDTRAGHGDGQAGQGAGRRVRRPAGLRRRAHRTRAEAAPHRDDDHRLRMRRRRRGWRRPRDRTICRVRLA